MMRIQKYCNYQLSECRNRKMISEGITEALEMISYQNVRTVKLISKPTFQIFKQLIGLEVCRD